MPTIIFATAPENAFDAIARTLTGEAKFEVPPATAGTHVSVHTSLWGDFNKED